MQRLYNKAHRRSGEISSGLVLATLFALLLGNLTATQTNIRRVSRADDTSVVISTPEACGTEFSIKTGRLVLIKRLALHNAATGEIYELDRADQAYNDTRRQKTPRGYTAYRSSLANPDSLKIVWGRQTYDHADIPAGSVAVKLASGGGGRSADFYYYSNLPEWLRSGESIEVLFEYYLYEEQSCVRRDEFAKRELSQTCDIKITPTPTGVLPSPTPTETQITPSPTQMMSPTTTPTPSATPTMPDAPTLNPTATSTPTRPPGVCFESCGTGRTCQQGLICIDLPFPGATRCVNPNNQTDPQCRPPSPTPTPQACIASIGFVIDTSSTMRSVPPGGSKTRLQTAQEQIDQALRTSLIQNSRFALAEFNQGWTLHSTVLSRTDFLNTLNGLRGDGGTYISGAMRNVSQLNADVVFFITDGIPSYDADGCFYGDDGYMAGLNFAAITSSSGDTIGRRDASLNPGPRGRMPALCKDRHYGAALAEIRQTSIAGPRKVYAVEVPSSQNLQRGVLSHIGEYVQGQSIGVAIERAIAEQCGEGQQTTLACDINSDGTTNTLDLAICFSESSLDSAQSCDINSDGVVNARDISFVYSCL